MTIKIEIPSGNEHKILAAAIGAALVAYSKDVIVENGDIEAAVAIEPSATEAPKSVETVTEQASSTETKASEVVTASSQSSEVKTTGGESQETSQEQSNAEQGAGGAVGATVVNDTIVDGTRISSNGVDSLDEKGVGFNAAFCGKAAKPFYGSGRDKGQWKKRQGVEKSDYDSWYSESLAAVSSGGTVGEEGIDTANAFTPDNVTQIDTANAFQNGEQQNDGKNHQPEKPGGLTFDDAGPFMQWLSEQQAAELITAGDIDSAYAATQSSMGDLFDPSKSANAIAAVYNYLSNIAEGQA